MKLRALTLLPLTAALLVLAGAEPAGAAACTIQQLTDTTGSNHNPRISDDGTVVSFSSHADLTGSNADHSGEIFRLDLAQGGPPEQVTDATGDELLRGELSGDGDRIVFSSRGEHGAGGVNTDGFDEIWLWDVDGEGPGSIQQLTDSNRSSSQPTINADGTRIGFISRADLTGENADLNREVFVHDTVSGTTTQVTDTPDPGEQFNPVIDASGTRVVFVSDHDLTGATHDGGRDLFRMNIVTGAVARLANASVTGIEPESVDADASVVSLLAEAIDLTGGNPDDSYELYTHRAGAGLSQVTDLEPGQNVQYSRLDATGDRLAFVSDGDLVGENDEHGYQLFVLDRTGRPGLHQLTDGAADIGEIDMSADGTRIVADSSGDLVGTNPDHNPEIFLFTCGAAGPTFTDVRPGNFFYEQVEWMAAAHVANGFPNGTFKPTDAVKRQQMANFLHNLAGRPPFTPPTPRTFTDVPRTNPFFRQIEWMVDAGIANGFPNGTFKPGQPVKRQQMAHFLYVMAGEPSFTPPGTPTFSDVPASNPFFLEVEWMAAEGIANGFPNGTFKPTDAVKRQQMANFLLNLVNGPGVDLD